MSTFITILLDLALGGMAYKLARSLEKTVVLLAKGHEDLARRITILETNPFNRV
jgi:hypothetical protein